MRIFTLSILVAAFLTACGTYEVPNRNTESGYAIAPEAININFAGVGELQRIPHVGEKLALSIIEHRERFGPFRKPEHLLLIKGVSDKRFREIRHLIRVD